MVKSGNAMMYEGKNEPRAVTKDGVSVYCTYDMLVDPHSLAGHPDNPNKHPQSQLDLLAHIIKTNGWRWPIKVSRLSGFVVSGHGRLAAAMQLGLTEVPIEIQSYPSEAKEYEDLMADNRLAELAEIDEKATKQILEKIGKMGGDRILAGYGDAKKLLKKTEENYKNEEYAAEPPAAARTRKGDLWVMGKHRLLCGDATRMEDVDRLCGDIRCSLAFTSPPYNLGKAMGFRQTKGLKDNAYDEHDDEMSEDDYLRLLLDSLRNMLRHADYAVVNIQPLAGNKIPLIDFLYEAKEHFVDFAVWDKERAPPQMEPCILNSQFEFMLIFSHEVEPSRCINSANFKGDVSNVLRLAPGRNEYRDVHGAVFPIELPLWVQSKLNNAKRGPVLDLFGGTGTTLMASAQLDGQCLMTEISPNYCDLIVGRYVKEYGTKDVVLERDGKLIDYAEVFA